MHVEYKGMKFRMNFEGFWAASERTVPVPMREQARVLERKMNTVNIANLSIPDRDRNELEDLKRQHYRLYCAKVAAFAIGGEVVNEPEYPDEFLGNEVTDGPPRFSSVEEARAYIERVISS